jgi:hypothetical protein
VAAAADGDTIEIRTGETFDGTLTWQNKFLTIRAAAGFKPLIRGNNALAIQGINGADGTGGLFQGLQFDTSAPLATCVSFSSTGNSFTTATFEGCRFLSDVSIGGTGNYQPTITFRDSIFESAFGISGTGQSFARVNLVRNRLNFGVRIGGTGSYRKAVVSESNYLGDGFFIFDISTATTQLLATNNLIVNTGLGASDIGIVDNSRPFGDGIRFVNTTVVNFPIGIYAQAAVPGTFENMLLRNGDDILEPTPADAIRNSLIADGTFAGVGGNFSGVPVFERNFSLRRGSPGIDAGNNAAPGLPLVDFAGNNRVTDGDSNGVARVDVGAFELVPEPSSVVLVLGCALLPVRRGLGRRVTAV